jgi:RimJ/RimL family protein N-acetyltransferase
MNKPRIKLTPFESECNLKGLQKIAQWRNKSLVSLRSTYPTHPDLQIFWYKQVVSDKSVNYFYIYNCIGNLVGYCGLDKISTPNKTAEIGLLINPDIHKQGLGYAAAHKLLEYGFEKLDLNCIFAEVYSTTGNWNFWSKVGFKKEGMLRQRKFWNNQYYDSMIGSILKKEWLK